MGDIADHLTEDGELAKELHDTGQCSLLGICQECEEEQEMNEKLSVITAKDENWEYRCNSCKQLRFCPKEEKPKTCGNCGSEDITIGRPGTLPADEKDLPLNPRGAKRC